MITSIEPAQTTYNSRSAQQNQLEDMPETVFNSAQSAKKYLSRFITFNLKSLCPGLTDNTILYGLDGYILKIDNSPTNYKIDLLITPGAAISDSTLLILSKPQILSLDYSQLLNSDIDKIILVMEFSYDLSLVANRQQIFNKVGHKYSLAQSTPSIPPFVIKAFFTDKSNQVIDSNGLTWNPNSNKLFLSIFDIAFNADQTVFVIDQYIMNFNQSKALHSILSKYDIDYDLDSSITERVTNLSETGYDLLSITLDNVTYIVPKFSFIPDDIRAKIFYSFRYQIASRFAISDLPFYTRRVERRARISQTYHEHNN